MTLILLLACLVLAACLYVALVGGAEMRDELLTDLWRAEQEADDLRAEIHRRDANRPSGGAS